MKGRAVDTSSELSERIRRNMTPNLDGWMVRLMTEAADEIDRLRHLLNTAQNVIQQHAKKTE